MKILQICSRVPFPPNDGGAIATLAITRHLHLKGHKVHVLAINTLKHYQNDDVMQGLARLTTVPVNTDLSYSKAFLNLFKRIPYNIERFVSPDFSQKLIEVLKAETYDIIHIEGTFVAWTVDIIKKHAKAPVFLRAHNLEYQIWNRLAQNESNLLKKWYFSYLSDGVKRFESEYFNKFDHIFAISQPDKKGMEKMKVQTPITVIHAGIDFQASQGVHKDNVMEPNSLFFIGSLDWMPNVQGLDWFMAQVFPTLVEQNPAIVFHIAGKVMPDKYSNLEMPNVKVHGFVKDARAFMEMYGIMIVPLLSGGGMRVKIIEGMAVNKCIVSTSIGAEGINAKKDQEICIADSVEEFCAIISSLLNQPQLINAIGNRAKNYVDTNFNNERIIEKMIGIYEDVSRKGTISHAEQIAKPI